MKTTRPKWFDSIRVRKRTIIGTTLPPDYLISFGPRNICKPESTQERTEAAIEEIKNWLEHMMEVEEYGRP